MWAATSAAARSDRRGVPVWQAEPTGRGGLAVPSVLAATGGFEPRRLEPLKNRKMMKETDETDVKKQPYKTASKIEKKTKTQTLSERNLHLAVFWNRCTPNVQNTLEKRLKNSENVCSGCLLCSFLTANVWNLSPAGHFFRRKNMLQT